MLFRVQKRFFAANRAALLLGFIIVVLFTGCGASNDNQNSGVNLGNGALLSFIGIDGNVWLANADGSNAHAISSSHCPQNASCYGPPSWSPDGQEIAVFGPAPNINNGNLLYIFNRQGILVKNITPPNPDSSGQIVWVNSGQDIAFQGRVLSPTLKTTPLSILVMNVASGQLQSSIPIPQISGSTALCGDNTARSNALLSLVDLVINGFNGLRLTFSAAPDGSAYVVSNGTCQSSVSLVTAGGSAQTLAPLQSGGSVMQAQFSADGTHIVAVEEDTNGSSSIVEYSSGGTQGKTLYTANSALQPETARLSSPQWSVDGSKIFFMHNGDLWVINSDGTQAHSLLLTSSFNNGADMVEAEPIPSPDLTHLVWVQLEQSQIGAQPTTALIVGSINATQQVDVQPGAVWPAWS